MKIMQITFGEQVSKNNKINLFMHPKVLTQSLAFRACICTLKCYFYFFANLLLVNINKDLQMLQTVNGKFALWQLFWPGL